MVDSKLLSSVVFLWMIQSCFSPLTPLSVEASATAHTPKNNNHHHWIDAISHSTIFVARSKRHHASSTYEWKSGLAAMGATTCMPCCSSSMDHHHGRRRLLSSDNQQVSSVRRRRSTTTAEVTTPTAAAMVARTITTTTTPYDTTAPRSMAPTRSDDTRCLFVHHILCDNLLCQSIVELLVGSSSFILIIIIWTTTTTTCDPTPVTRRTTAIGSVACDQSNRIIPSASAR